ncbi:sigma factor [Amycolatopsis sp. NPDC004368]
MTASAHGDPEAIARLLERARPLIVRYCRARIGRRGGSFAKADEVAQEVCLGILVALPGRAGDRSFSATAYRIAQRQVREAGSGGEPADERLAGLLRLLPERQCEIMILRTVVGLSAEQTGDALGLGAAAVRVQQHRALTAMRKALGT